MHNGRETIMKKESLIFIIMAVFLLQSHSLLGQEKVIIKERAPQPEAKLIDEIALPQPPAPTPVKLSDEEYEALLKFYQQIDPDIRTKMAKLKVDEPYMHQHMLGHLYEEQIFLARLEKEAPERYKEAIEMRRLSAGTEKMAELYRQTDDDSEKKKIETDLRHILAQLFDLREKEKAQEIERIRSRLGKLEQEMQERRKNREIIINNRLNELTGKRVHYEW